MAVELATAYVSIIPETSKIAPHLRQTFGGSAVTGTAKAAGRRIGATLAESVASEAKRRNETLAKSLASGITKSQGDIARASKAIAAARESEVTAIGKVRVAETRLSEVRARATAAARKKTPIGPIDIRGNAGVVAAEEQLAAAQRGLNRSKLAGATASKQLALAESNVAAATRNLTAAQRAASAAGAQLTATQQRTTAAADTAATSTAATGREMGRAGGRARGMAGGFVGATVAIGGVIAAVGVLKGALSSGFDRLTTIQDATKSLTVQFQDAAKAGRLVERITAVVTGTPFALDQFVDAGQNLAAFGVSAQKIPGYLTSIADAAATKGKAAPEFVDRLSRSIGQAVADGRVMTETINELTAAGVPAAKILGKSLGVPQAKVREYAEQGRLVGPEFIDALVEGIQKRQGGLAKSLGTTLSGSLANAKISVTRAAARLIEPFTQNLTNYFNTFGKRVDAFSKKATALVNSAVAGFKSGGVAGATQSIGEKLGLDQPTIDKITKVITNFTTGFQKIRTFLVRDWWPALKNIFLLIAPVLGGAVGVISEGFRVLGSVLSVIGPPIKSFTEMLLRNKDTLFKVGAAIFAVTQPLTALVIGFIAAYNNSLTFRNKVRGAFATIGEVVGKVIGGMIRNFARLYDGATTVFAAIMHAADRTIGKLPYIGDGISDATKAFDEFRDSSVKSLYGLADDAEMIGAAIGANLRESIRAELQQKNMNLAFIARGGMGGPGGGGDPQSGFATEQEWRDALAEPGNTKPKLAPKKEKAPKAPKVTPAQRARQRIIDLIGAGFISSLTQGSPVQIRRVVEKLIKQVRIALSGSAESALVKRLGRERDALLKHSAALKENATALKNATDLRAKVADLRTNVQTSAIGNLTQLRSPKEIKNYLAERIGQVKRFAANISTLSKRGLPKFFLEQIINSGLDGSVLAEALAKSSGTDFAAIKSSAGILSAEAGKLGDTSTKAMYGVGLSAVDGVIAGLKAKKSELTAAILQLAKSMKAAIKKALGIKSPSRVFRTEVGQQVGEGAALGIEDMHSRVAAATAGLVTRPALPTFPAGAVRGGDGASAPVRLHPEDLDYLADAIVRRPAVLASGPAEVYAYAQAGRGTYERRHG